MTEQTTSIAATKQPSTPIDIADDGKIILRDIEQMSRYAGYALRSGFVPKAFDTPDKIVIAWQFGAELGLTRMQALRVLSVVNGRAAIHGKEAPTVVLASGLLEAWEETFEGTEGKDDWTAVCRVRRKGVATERVAKFSVADAKLAGLWGKNTWALYAKDMLTYKARARAFQLFSDVLAGLPILEDIMEVPAERTPLIPASREVRQAAPPATPDPLLASIKGAVTVEHQDVAAAESAELVVTTSSDANVTAAHPPLFPEIGKKETASFMGRIAKSESVDALKAIFTNLAKAFSEGTITEEQHAAASKALSARRKAIEKAKK